MERITAIPGSLPGTSRPAVLTIAGMDPSGGAGLLSDIKTFEQSGVYGLGIHTGNTIQTDLRFFDMQWTTMGFIADSVRHLADRFEVAAIKIGVLPTINHLFELMEILKTHWPDAAIVWDPVIRSSTAFPFMNPESWTDQDRAQLPKILQQLTLLTPNLTEAEILARAISQGINASGIKSFAATTDLAGELAGKFISHYCPVLLTGGHREYARGTDILYITGTYADVSTDLPTGDAQRMHKDNALSQQLEISPDKDVIIAEKHGSGCILSAAITAALANGQTLAAACIKGKAYTTAFLSSNQTLLGLHVQ